MYFIRDMRCINPPEIMRYMSNMRYIRDIYKIFIYNIKYIGYGFYINYDLYKLCISFGT